MNKLVISEVKQDGQGPLAVHSPVVSEKPELQTPVAYSSTTTIEKHLGPVDGNARVEAYLKRMCGRVGITIEEFWLLDEMQLAVAAVVSKEDHHTWPFTAKDLAVFVNQEREKTQKQPTSENDVRNVMDKLFGSNKKSCIWIGHIEMRQVLCKEIDHNGNEIVVPRYSLKNHISRERFLKNLEAMKKGEERADDELSWKDLHDLLGIKQVPPLDEVKRSASRTRFVEDPHFAAMDPDTRIRTYWANYRWHRRERVCLEHGITKNEWRLLLDLIDYAVASNAPEFASTVDLAALVSTMRAKRFVPAIWWSPTLVTPLRLGTVLERLSKQKGADSYSVDIVGVERKVVEQTDINGQPVLVPHYRFTDLSNWDYMELEDAEQELKERLIKMGVIVRTAEGQWVNKYTGKVLFTCK